ncbi:MAG TPA: glycosyltransferase family 4 protein [Pyrinomonadaceae bacterium]|nr:glycosyltransferase family 4 protein [Pyrinomonadaceae bacterium]
MRILFANDGLRDAGGVQSYLTAVTEGLIRRGHQLAFLHCQSTDVNQSSLSGESFPHFSTAHGGVEGALKHVNEFAPDVCYSHNMNDLKLEQVLLDSFPVVKFMHGYFGTCISGLKTHHFPSPTPCARTFGKACLLYYFPRRCGEFSAIKMIEHYQWSNQQQQLFRRYAAMVVASSHMKHEFVANGMDGSKVHVNPLFSATVTDHSNGSGPAQPCVLFVGRMTKLKGGDVLVRAVSEASKRIHHSIQLVMVGDGPQRAEWEQLALGLGVQAHFTGWLDDELELARRFKEASVLAVPSLWPEPFGLVGLEAAKFGVPAVAFDVGGIPSWLDDGKNGVLVPLRNGGHEHLGRALAEMFSDAERLSMMGRAARSKSAEMSLEKHLDQLEEILSRASAANN